MIFNKLNLHHFRNLLSYSLDCHPQFNLIIGQNGAGKSSILEAIYFLSYGRSHRSKQINRIVQSDQQQFILFAQCDDHKIGLLRDIAGNSEVKQDGQVLKSHVEITQKLPVLLFHPESFLLLTEGSKPRRELIDWGLFYAKPGFLKLWQQYKQVLKQRNALLKSQAAKVQVEYWDALLIQLAEQIDPLRLHYVEQLTEALQTILSQFLLDHEIKLSYYRGWAKEVDLKSRLADNFCQDQNNGFTSSGPHRADLKITVKGKPVHEVLSRGQQKILIASLKLAQGLLLKAIDQKCIYLLDDLGSELDQQHQEQLIDILRQLDSQVFITSINENIVECFDQAEYNASQL